MNPDISFDAGVRRPSDNTFIASWAHTRLETQMGVLYNGQYICGMDRGIVPEFTLWDTKPGIKEVHLSDAVASGEAQVLYFQILPKDPNYSEAYRKAELGDDQYRIEGDKLFFYKAIKEGRVRDRINRLGWRRTFERLIAANIPGITRRSLSEAFGIDMGVD